MSLRNSPTFIIAGVSTVAFATCLPTPPAYAESYIAGDFHNHTTCNDGATSVQTMVTASLDTFGLDWMGDSGHGGSFPNDCRFDESNGGPIFADVSLGVAAFKGDSIIANGHRAMWEWQIMQDYHYPITMGIARQLGKTMVYLGTEQNVPGHEHASTTVVDGQKTGAEGKGAGDVFAAAEFEYRFDRNDTDTKAGAPEHNWTGKVANATGPTLGTLNHINKAVPGVAWLQTNYPLTSYFIPAHLERAGVFDPTNNRGYNIEHLRDFNNAGPTVAFGFETMPGHQASNFRGEYRAGFGGPGIDSVGVTTYGGTGIYGAKIGGVWDALLGEGRNWFFYASSDFHNRGIYSPFVRQSTQDFYPGEYQKAYIPKPYGAAPAPKDVVDQLRTGNSYSVTGDLIGSEFTFMAQVPGMRNAATMGQTITVPRGRSVTITLSVEDPITPNRSPYSFNNPSLRQIGISEPLNQPTLDHVDFIGGDIAGVIAPNSPNYTNGTNPTARILATFNKSSWTAKGTTRIMTFTIPNVQSNQYVRVRGTNLPAGTPNETDAQGNPLSDQPTSNIPCIDPACPVHMQVVNGEKRSSFDVAAWADLWFYANPIFIRVGGEPELLAETNAKLAESLR